MAGILSCKGTRCQGAQVCTKSGCRQSSGMPQKVPLTWMTTFQAIQELTLLVECVQRPLDALGGSLRCAAVLKVSRIHERKGQQPKMPSAACHWPAVPFPT